MINPFYSKPLLKIKTYKNSIQLYNQIVDSIPAFGKARNKENRL